MPSLTKYLVTLALGILSLAIPNTFIISTTHRHVTLEVLQVVQDSIKLSSIACYSHTDLVATAAIAATSFASTTSTNWNTWSSRWSQSFFGAFLWSVTYLDRSYKPTQLLCSLKSENSSLVQTPRCIEVSCVEWLLPGASCYPPY